ncbi:hypothetical protein PPACK8108_LOCUS2972 [Phakopsora pachyrhizi]|uniref:Protein MON2 n=1 Tax=Phakopsora pachyrhizi TaxID=170000 RepID=A0AAV0ALQ6_PHAPC|nr:hypothetical protein PPACK8108_LOCUS2972 [Phakopsora pachyrhizi]
MASSSHFSLLMSDFQALASETKRKHADIKEASDKALTLLKSSPEDALVALRNTGPNLSNLGEDIFRPISLACGTKNSKIVAIALGGLQRLIGMDATPITKIPFIIGVLSNILPLGVEIQLRVLQTLPSLFTNCSRYLHDSLLADALLLCFRLQDSKIGVVSSTSAATLRQLVMVVFEGVAEEDKAVLSKLINEPDPDQSRILTDFVVDIPPFESVHLSGEIERTEARRVALRPSAKDAYLVFEDLCLLVNGDSPSFLKLQSLPKTFGLELIESVMTGHGHLFQQHPELIFILRAQLCPLLIRALSEKPNFPLTLRLMRVAFLLLKQFSDDLLVEAEIFLSLLIKTVSIDHSESQVESQPMWYRVLALEIFRGLCADFDLLLKVFERYDFRSSDKSLGLFTSMMGTFNRLASEKPNLLGINQDITFGSLPTYQSGSSSHPGVQGMIDGVVGMATQAAAPLVGVPQGGLTLGNAAMKVQCIDQLDKAEAPVIPETYVYLLSLQCLSSVAEGFAGYALFQNEALQPSKPGSSPDSPLSALPAPKPNDLNKKQPNGNLKVARAMADASWPALLASLNFFVSTNLDDQLFNETLTAMQSFTCACGILDLTTPRDAFLLSFCKFSVPPVIVANLVSEISGGNSNKNTQSVLSVDSLGLGGGSAAACSLSIRNMAFLRTLLSVAQYLSGTLGNTWYTVFETLQSADFVLTFKSKKRSNQTSNPTITPGAPSNVADESGILASIQKLFDSSRNLDSEAFLSFVDALCRLSAEMVSLSYESEAEFNRDGAPNTPKLEPPRRVTSGMAAFRTLRQSERSFGVTKLGTVALLNIRRLILSEPALGWTPITSHLLTLQHFVEAPNGIRLQAADVLDRIVLAIPKLLNNAELSLQRRIQAEIIAVLASQTEPGERSPTLTDIEVRKLGFETLFKVLENNGHSFMAGWKLILDVLRVACMPLSTSSITNATAPRSASATSLGGPAPRSSNSSTNKLSLLIRTSFPSLQLICTDFLTALDLDELRQCISVLAVFGQQTDDINIALTAGGLLWQVSDYVQGKNKSAESGDDSYVQIWMYLLTKLLRLTYSFRQEVRDGAIQTLFRTVGLYGSLLSPEIWHKLLWEVVFPLFDQLTNMIQQTPSELKNSAQKNLPVDVSRQPNGAPIDLAAKQRDESKILALNSLGTVVSDHLYSHIICTSQFLRTWSSLVQTLYYSFTEDRPEVSEVAIKTLTTILNSKSLGSTPVDVMSTAWGIAWDTVVKMSEVISNASKETTIQGIYFTQATLEAYLKVLTPLQKSGRLEMTLERVKKLLEICKVVITYSNSPDYRPDIDSLPPVPSAAILTIDDIQLEHPSAPSAVIITLAELSTLPFVSPYQVEDPFSSRHSMNVTYIALFKKIQPRLLHLLERFGHTPQIYNEGAATYLLKSLAIPIRLKYGCPAPSKVLDSESQPLWKISSTTFLTIVKGCMPQLRELSEAIDQPHFEDFWKQLVETFSGLFSADCEPSNNSDLDKQRKEENFDLAFIASLELDVLPHLGQLRIPEETIKILCKNIQSASRLYTLDLDLDSKQIMNLNEDYKSHIPKESSFSKGCRFIDDFRLQASSELWGTSAEIVERPRERFSYWCFDLLFLFCNQVDGTKAEKSERKRVASICCPILLSRCAAAIKIYVADASIRNQIPFSRLRQEEIAYILSQLLQAKFWDGLLSEARQKADKHQPNFVSSSADDKLQKLLIKIPDSHLLYLQPLLIDLLFCETKLIDGLKPLAAIKNSQRYSELASFLPSDLEKSQTYNTYREIFQARDKKGGGLDGIWPGLVLGEVGTCSNDRYFKNESGNCNIKNFEGSHFYHQDIKHLVLICFRRLSKWTTPIFF